MMDFLVLDNINYNDNLYKIICKYTDEIVEHDFYPYAIKFELINLTQCYCFSYGYIEFISGDLNTDYSLYICSDDKQTLEFFHTTLVTLCLQMIFKKYPNLAIEQPYFSDWFTNDLCGLILEFIKKNK